MIKSILVAALIAVSSVAVHAKAVAFADLNLGKTAIVLHDDTRHCNEGFLYAAITWQGRPLNACWRLVNTPGEPGVHIIDEDGDQGVVPAAAFQKVQDL